jgi:hypothetical protein
VDDALSFFCVGLEEGFDGVCGEGEAWEDGGLCGSAWCGGVGEEDAIFARELFEGYWYEGADTAYDEDLGLLVVMLARLVCSRKR